MIEWLYYFGMLLFIGLWAISVVAGIVWATMKLPTPVVVLIMVILSSAIFATIIVTR